MEGLDRRVVVTTSWLRFLAREAFVRILEQTGLGKVVDSLRPPCAAFHDTGKTRAEAIEAWLKAHHGGERYVILDDTLCGTGLEESGHFATGRTVLCDIGKGFDVPHLQLIRRAFSES